MNATGIVPAKRGDIVALTEIRSSTFAFGSGRETDRREVRRLGIVSSITRDGFVKRADAVSPNGEISTGFFREIKAPMLCPRFRLRRPAPEIIAEIGDEFDADASIVEALRPHVKTDRELEFEKLPALVREIINGCRSGQVLFLTKRVNDAGISEQLYSLHPNGKTAGAKASQQAIESGFLLPNNDGLFEAENSQTWRAA